MRNRVYITSLYSKADINKGTGLLTDALVKNWTFTNKNILTFVPSLDALFLNGKKYCSINSNVDSVNNDIVDPSVFSLAIIREANKNGDDGNIYDTNYIKLVQERLRREFDIESLILHVNYNVNGFNNRLLFLNMSVGERVQIFMNKNSGFVIETTNPNAVVVDRNFIIHAISTPGTEETPTIYIKHNDKVLYQINVLIRYAYNTNICDDRLTEELFDDALVDSDIIDYSNIVTNYTNIIETSPLRHRELATEEYYTERNMTLEQMSEHTTVGEAVV